MSTAHGAHDESGGTYARLALRFKPEDRRYGYDEAHAPEYVEHITLGQATHLELADDQIRFLVPLTGARPDQHWLRTLHERLNFWPAELAKPMLEEGRGLWLGPLLVTRLEEHVEALREVVRDTNRAYVEVVLPELRRQEEEARRREEERKHLRADVEDRLKKLLG